jgi:hypothetical protein
LIHATAGNAAYLYGRIHVAVAGSSPGIGNANVIDNSDGPATTWQAYAPALVFGGGGAGTATGRSKTINHVTFIELSITVTTGGTLTSFSLPKNSFATGLLHGRELAAVGQPWTAITGAGTAAAVRDADNNSAVTAGWLLRFSGSYESV